MPIYEYECESCKKRFEYTPSIDGDFWFGHHYEMFRMAATFREMVKTKKEPIPHEEIVAVTAKVSPCRDINWFARTLN